MLPSDSLALREMYDPVCYVTGSKKGGGGLSPWFAYEAPLWSITECMPDSHAECEMSVFVGKMLLELTLGSDDVLSPIGMRRRTRSETSLQHLDYEPIGVLSPGMMSLWVLEWALLWPTL